MNEFVEYILSLKEKKAYRFIPRRDLIYSQKEFMEMLSDWNRIGIPDEMVNITFNREFYSQENKNIIKMINMYRDHNNLILACVPHFHVLDNQIKNLCKIRLSVIRRGVAILQTPNSTIYGRDKWDTMVNEKIEREWLMKNSRKPMYSRLTTARGIVKFPPLKQSDENRYQDIKNRKRTIILENEMGLKKKKDSPLDKIIQLLNDGNELSEESLKGIAFTMGIKLQTLKNKIRDAMKKERLIKEEEKKESIVVEQELGF